jgi:hypothetical protein
MVFDSEPTGRLAKNSLQRCDSVYDDRVTGEGYLARVEISEKGVYIVMAIVVVAGVVVAAVVVSVGVVAAAALAAVVVTAAVVLAVVVVAAVVVTAAKVELRLIVVVVVVLVVVVVVVVVVVFKDTSKRMASHHQNVIYSLGPSRSGWEDVECKLRCVNFRRVSDPRRAFLPALRLTGSTDQNPGSAGYKPVTSWEHWRHVWKDNESQ